MPKAKKSYAKEKSQLLSALLEQSKKKGFIRSETILERFARYRLNEEEKEDIFLEFEKIGIQVVFPNSLTDSFLYDIEDDLIDYEFQDEKDLQDYDGTVDSLNQYLQDIRKFPLLSHKETLNLVREVQLGNINAQETLVNCNLRFAYSIALNYRWTGLSLLDLVQQANIGLMSAVVRFNPNRGTKFTTYAIFWIKQEILNYIQKQSKLIEVPNYICSALKKIRTVSQDFYNENNRYPTDDEIATLTEFSIARVKHLKTHEYSVASLDSPLNADTDSSLLDLIEDSGSIDLTLSISIGERKEYISNFLKQLSAREYQVIVLRFGLEGQQKHNLEETGKIMGLTMERVRQIESMALNKIRNMNGSNILRNFIKL